MRFGPGDVLPALLAGTAAALVYWPITRTYFHQDDFLNLFQLIDLPAPDFLGTMHGGHLLIARNLVFLIHHHLFGTRSELYMAAAWLTHVANVVLLYALVYALTARRLLAAFAAAWWGVSAINEGALNWYSVYGQVLGLTCVLVVLWGLARRAARGDARWAPPLLWAALLAIASASFGTGLGMTLAMPLVALWWLPRGPIRWRAAAVLALTAVAMVALYAAARSRPDAVRGGMPPMAQLMAVGQRWSTAITFLRYFLTCGLSSIALSTWYRYGLGVGIIGTGLAGATAIFLAIGLGRGPARTRGHIAGALLLATSAYALIVTGRLFRAAQMAVVVIEPRYHYAAPALLLVALAVAAGSLLGTFRLAPWRRMALLALGALLGAIGYARDGPMNHFDDVRRQTATTLASIRAAVAAAPPAAPVSLPIRPFRAAGTLIDQMPAIFPGTAAAFVIFEPTNQIDGHPVFFIADPPVYAATRRGRRTSTLVVSRSSTHAQR